MVRDAGLKVLLAGDAPGEPRTRADVLAEALGPDLGMLNCPGYSADSFAPVRTVFTVAPTEALRSSSGGCRTAPWSTRTG